MTLESKKITKFLFILEGIGAVFVGIFLLAYLGGLPTTLVLHSEPAFRIPLTIFGVALLILLLATLVIALFSKNSHKKSTYSP